MRVAAFIKRTKSFLAAPGEVSVMFNPEEDNALVGYWQHPFETTFHLTDGATPGACSCSQAIEFASEEAEVMLVERIA
jgi:hypothetical protein